MDSSTKINLIKILALFVLIFSLFYFVVKQPGNERNRKLIDFSEQLVRGRYQATDSYEDVREKKSHAPATIGVYTSPVVPCSPGRETPESPICAFFGTKIENSPGWQDFERIFDIYPGLNFDSRTPMN